MASQGEYSDDDLSKPAPIASQLFRDGPITLRAYREACEKTPAQPRRSRGGRLKAPSREQQRDTTSVKAPETRPNQVTTSRVDNIFDLPVSQNSEIHRSPDSSLEPRGQVSKTNSFVSRRDEPLIQENGLSDERRPHRQKNSSGNSLSYIFGERRVKKQSAAKRPHPRAASRTSHHASDSENIPQDPPPRATVRKRRRLPMENELVMVPALDDTPRQSVGKKGATRYNLLNFESHKRSLPVPKLILLRRLKLFSPRDLLIRSHGKHADVLPDSFRKLFVFHNDVTTLPWRPSVFVL
jgi:hypothetical protein